MLELKVFVVKLLSVDALSAGTIASSEISALDHEALDDAVELGPLVVKWLSCFACALLSCTEGSKVLCCFWYDCTWWLVDRSRQSP